MTTEREFETVLFWIALAPAAWLIGLALDWLTWRMHGRRAGVTFRHWRATAPPPPWRNDPEP